MSTKEIKDALAQMERSEQEEVYKFLKKILGYADPDRSTKEVPLSSVATRPSPGGSGSGIERISFGGVSLPDEIPLDPPSYKNMVDDDDEDDDDDDDACSLYRKVSSSPQRGQEKPKAKKSGGISVFDREWSASMTDFNPDTAKNVLQQYYQTFIHPSMTPTYIRHCGYSEVKFQIERGGETVSVKGYGKRAIEEEKNAALRAIVYLEQHNPRFRTLRLPSNARLQRDDDMETTGSSCVPGLSELNAATFLFHCRDIGVLAEVNRSPKAHAGGGFCGYTVLVVSNGRSSPEFKTPMHGRKKDAQNAADLQAAEWVVQNLHVRVPPTM